MAASKHEKLIPLVKDLYLKGYTKNKISQMIGVHSQVVSYILYNKLKMADRKSNLVNEMPRDLVNRVVTLACWGYSRKEIAEDVKVKEKIVSDLIQEATDKKIIKKFC